MKKIVAVSMLTLALAACGKKEEVTVEATPAAPVADAPATVPAEGVTATAEAAASSAAPASK